MWMLLTGSKPREKENAHHTILQGISEYPEKQDEGMMDPVVNTVDQPKKR